MSKHLTEEQAKKSELIDFYYSPKQHEIYKKSWTTTKPNANLWVNIDGKDMQYTERTQHGKELTSKWDDFQFLGTATSSDVTINGVKQGSL